MTNSHNQTQTSEQLLERVKYKIIDAHEVLQRSILAHVSKSILYWIAQVASLIISVSVFCVAIWIPTEPKIFSEKVDDLIVVQGAIQNESVSNFLMAIKFFIALLGFGFLLSAYLIARIRKKNTRLLEASERIGEIRDLFQKNSI